MPKTIETTVYLYSELPSEKAKEKARQWWTKGAFDWPWYESEKESFESFLTDSGFDNIESQFSGFYSQGDGASFDFKGIEWQKLAAKPENCKPYSDILESWQNQNKALLRNVLRIRDLLSAESAKNGYSYHYCHEKTRCVSLELNDSGYERPAKLLNRVYSELEKSLTDLTRDLARAYFNVLESEYESMHEEPYIAESMAANEYTFTESGKRFG